MLTLADASRFFDRTPICDVESGAVLFYGQVDPYADAVRDSATAYRRILSVKPGTSVYEGLQVSIFNDVWIIGGRETDGMLEPHRAKYVLHPAKYRLAIRNLSDYLLNVPYTSVCGDFSWSKDAKSESVTSSTTPIYALYVGQYTAVPEFSVVQVIARPTTSFFEYCFNPLDHVGLLTSAPKLQASGIRSSTCTDLEYAVEDATLVTRAYDPVAGGYTASANATVRCQRVRWQSLYLYGSQGEAKYQEGDCSLVFPAGTTLNTASKVTLAGQAWSILAVETLGGAVVAHGRRG